MKKPTTIALICAVILSAAFQADAARPANLQDSISTSPNSYSVWYTDDDTSDADYFPAAMAQQAADALESAHTRYVTNYGFHAPSWTSNNRETWIYDSGNTGEATGGTLTLDSPKIRNRAEPFVRLVILHELFHHVEFAYVGFPQWQVWGAWVFEAQANLMEDKTFSDLDNDKTNSLYDNRVKSYLSNPGISLMDLSYKASLFWNYVAERFGSNPNDFFVGVEAIREFWERCEGNTPDSVRYLNETIAFFEPGSDLSDIFHDFLITNYTKDLDLSGIFNSDLYQYIDDNSTPYPKVKRTTHTLPPDQVNKSGSLPIWSGKYYEAIVPADSTLTGFKAKSTNGKPLAFGVVSVNDTGTALQLFKGVGTEFAVAFYNSGVDRVAKIGAVIGALEDKADYQYTFAAGNDVAITIKSPGTAYPAYVGEKNTPEQFVARVRVIGPPSLGTPSVMGLHYTDFSAIVGFKQAQVLAGDYVDGDYWLVIQAPVQTAVPEVYNLRISLGNDFGDTDNAVIYRKIVRDQVMVIDGSGSMLSGNRIEAAQTAAALLVDAKPDNDMVGVVSFGGDGVEPNNDAVVEYALDVVDDISRMNAITSIAAINIADPFVMTSIGDGLAEGQNQLDKRGVPDHEHIMILLSDGMENEASYWNNVKNDIKSKGTVVHTIALGTGQFNTLLEAIADETKGEYYYVDAAVAAAAAPSAATTIAPLNAVPSTPELMPVEVRLADTFREVEEQIGGKERLWSYYGTMPGGTNDIFELLIDEGQVVEAVVSVSWANPADELNLTLEAPDGSLIDPGTPGIQFFRYDTHKVYHIPNMDRGRWLINIESVAGADADFVATVSAKVIEGAKMQTWIHSDDPTRPWGLPLGLRVQLYDINGPITGGTVTARVQHPAGMTETVKLKDDGAHNDGSPDDGIYGFLYTKTTVGGSYVFEFKAVGLTNGGAGFTRIKKSAVYVTNNYEMDLDYDGMPDLWENLHGLIVGIDDSGEDNDNENIFNIDEFYNGTNPRNPDSDRGGESDSSELENGRNPLDEDDDAMPRPIDVDVVDEIGCADVGQANFIPYANLIRFPVSSSYQAVEIYRHTGPGIIQDFTLLDIIDPNLYMGLYPDEGLIDGQEYFYYIVGEGFSGEKSVRSHVFSGTAKADPVPPKGWLRINDGSGRVTSLSATLYFDPSPDSTEVLIANDSNFTAARWIAKPVSTPWTLVLESGPVQYATVHVKFRDPAGNESIIYSESVLYDPDQDADNDGIIDPLDPDDDNDGLPDIVEGPLGLSPYDADTDNDGILDGDEDADNDGQSNYTEVVGGSDPGNKLSLFKPTSIELNGNILTIKWLYLAGRDYMLVSSAAMSGGAVWQPVPGTYTVAGDTAIQTDILSGAKKFYKVEASLIGDINFDSITKNDIANAAVTAAEIPGDDANNQLTPGSIILCHTSLGRYTKFLVEAFDPNVSNNLTIRWVTYNPDGLVYTQGSGLIIHGTYSCDLDFGWEAFTGSDFWWAINTATTRSLVPENGALFLKVK